MWYTSEYAEEIFGARAHDAQYKETEVQVVEHLRPVGQIMKWQENLNLLYKSNPQILQKHLKNGIQYNNLFLSKNFSSDTLEDILKFSFGMAMYATIVPYLAGECVLKNEQKNSELYEDIITLRSHSYYGEMFEKYIMPLASEILSRRRIDPVLLTYATYDELMCISPEELLIRQKNQKEGKYFVYHCTTESKNLMYISNLPTKKIPLTQELTGIVAHSGNVIGKVCTVKNANDAEKMNQ